MCAVHHEQDDSGSTCTQAAGEGLRLLLPKRVVAGVKACSSLCACCANCCCNPYLTSARICPSTRARTAHDNLLLLLLLLLLLPTDVPSVHQPL
jgi:hypothetical protein